MNDLLSQSHLETYDTLADEYEDRVEKLRPVTEYALSHLISQLKPKSKVLDIGCAVGYTVEILNSAGMDAEGIDISPAMIAHARKRNPDSKLVVGDFIEKEYPVNYYDAALMYAFIHLFPLAQAQQFLNKTSSILKTGGLLFVGTTKSDQSSEGWEKKIDYAGQPKRYRKRWTQSELEKVLSNSGFKVIYQEDIKDEFGKIWMDYVVRKVN